MRKMRITESQLRRVIREQLALDQSLKKAVYDAVKSRRPQDSNIEQISRMTRMPAARIKPILDSMVQAGQLEMIGNDYAVTPGFYQ